jgi:hypothetical protein
VVEEQETKAPELVQQLDLLLEEQVKTNRMLRSTLFATRVVAVAAAVMLFVWVFWFALVLILGISFSTD